MKINNKSKLSSESIEKLVLDAGNPRFAELYSGSNREEDLIEYLLYTEAAEEIAKTIIHANEFYPDEPLWVLHKDNKYLVKDGNRRCSAVKALQAPGKYRLNFRKFILNELPVLIFEDEDYLNQRIREKHASGLFREWERIAKALQVHALYTSGSSIDSMKEIDSQPSRLIKLASFYYEAVNIGGENLKKLLRRGRGKTGGKTIVFERLFKYSKFCGYSFKNKPSYKINILNQDQFSKYISAMVKYLEANPKTSHKTIDADGESFLDKLKEFGFEKEIPKIKTNSKKNTDKIQESKKVYSKGGGSTADKRGSVESRPKPERKRVPAALIRLIKECYDLDQNNFANAKTVLTRVSFECVLKYVVEETKYNGKNSFAESVFFSSAFPKQQNGASAGFVNFKKLKLKFAELIKNTGKKKAFNNFDFDSIEQVIHNYNVGAVPNNAKGFCENLIPLINFMLQEESDLLSSLDLTKL